MIDDCSFYGETFGARMEVAVKRVFELIEKSAEVESKLLLMNLLKVFASQAQEQFRVVARPVMETLLGLWQKLFDQPMIKSSILRVLSDLLPLTGLHASLFPSLRPILSYSIDLSHSESLYLLDDGLSLWATIRLFSSSSSLIF